MKRCRGLTLTELAIATTIVLVVASVAVPNAVSRRIAANEAAAVTALRDIADAQAKFQASGACDVYANGVGEFGLLRELAGVVGVRTVADGGVLGNRLDPPLLPAAFGRLHRNGELLYSGYLFHVVLPGFAVGYGVMEVRDGALGDSLDTDLSATTWGCYAWPQHHGRTGNRTFFVNQADEIVTTESSTYSGRGAIRSSNAGAAFAFGGPPSRITGQLAVGTVGRDGNFWRPVTSRAAERRLVSRGTFDRRLFFRGRDGSFEIESRQSLTATDEMMLVRANGLPPRVTYWLLLQAPTGAPPALFGKVVADPSGHVEFRFDSRADAYPDGVTSLTALGGGWMSIVDSDGSVLYLRIPEFVESNGAPPAPTDLDSNERAAIDTLREIAAAQTLFQASGACDVDWDRIGEFGMLRELSGTTGVRNFSNAATQGAALIPGLLPTSLGNANANYESSRSGYLFHVILPGAAGVGVLEVSGTAALAASLDTDLAETTWCCYAWPQQYGRTGRRAFFINELGDIVATDSGQYSGIGDFTGANAGAAFVSGGPATNITGRVATGTVGRDGNLWRAVPSRADEHVFAVRGAATPPTAGSSAAATFTIDAKHLENRTDETIDIRCTGLAARASFRVLLTNATRALTADFGSVTSDARGRAEFVFDSRWRAFPDGVASLTEFGGGTLEITDGDAVVLSGAIPAFATVRGPAMPDSSVVFHAAKPLDATPEQLPRRGTLDVRVANEPAGRTEQLTIDVKTWDRASGPFAVVAIGDLGTETVLGAIDVRGLTASGKLVLDSRVAAIPGGGLVALSGRRIEVRTSTGFVVLTGTVPIID